MVAAAARMAVRKLQQRQQKPLCNDWNESGKEVGNESVLVEQHEKHVDMPFLLLAQEITLWMPHSFDEVDGLTTMAYAF